MQTLAKHLRRRTIDVIKHRAVVFQYQVRII